MRQVIAGNGSDSTSATFAYLKAGNEFRMANLYLIGTPDDPAALWLTDWEAPIWWPVWGDVPFQPAVIKRGTVETTIGFDVKTLELEWTPANSTYSALISSANPYQLAQIGYYDNKPVRVWTVFMPTPGDAMTYGACALFGGRIADTTVERGKIAWKVNSFLDVVNQQVPLNTIELLSTAASYTGATPPAGFSTVPQFDVITGDSTTLVEGDCTNIGPHQIFGTDKLRHGYMVFKDGPGATLAGVWAAIQQNTQVTIGGNNYNQFVLYAPLPWPPKPGVDTFYVSAAAPINQADGSYVGFPYVPAPEIAA